MKATLLNSLQHPNIVKCFGVAIMPPAIALITEFCHLGTHSLTHSLTYSLTHLLTHLLTYLLTYLLILGSLYDFLHTFDAPVRKNKGISEDATHSSRNSLTGGTTTSNDGTLNDLHRIR